MIYRPTKDEISLDVHILIDYYVLDICSFYRISYFVFRMYVF
jgi:hypothetical protein